jgi:hypothetical protein
MDEKWMLVMMMVMAMVMLVMMLGMSHVITCAILQVYSKCQSFHLQ